MSDESKVQAEIQQAIKQPVDLGGCSSAGMYTSAQPQQAINNPSQEFAMASAIRYEMRISDLNQMWWLAEHLCRSAFVPKEMRGDVTNVFISMLYGMEVGLRPIHAIQNIMEIKGRMAIWGDAMLALIQSNPLCEDVIEEIIHVEGEGLTAKCTVKRRGRSDTVRIFSERQAKQAGLWGKDVWKNYPERMLGMRARSWSCRDSFSDALHGLIAVEEAWDIPSNSSPVQSQPVQPQPVVVEPQPVQPQPHALSHAVYESAAKLQTPEPTPAPTPPTGEDIQALKDDLAKCDAEFQMMLHTWILDPMPKGLGLKSIDELNNGRYHNIRIRVDQQLNNMKLDNATNIIKLTSLAKNVPIPYLMSYLEEQGYLSESELAESEEWDMFSEIPGELVKRLLNEWEAVNNYYKHNKPISKKNLDSLKNQISSLNLTEDVVLSYLRNKNMFIGKLAQLPSSALERLSTELPNIAQFPPIED